MYNSTVQCTCRVASQSASPAGRRSHWTGDEAVTSVWFKSSFGIVLCFHHPSMFIITVSFVVRSFWDLTQFVKVYSLPCCYPATLCTMTRLKRKCCGTTARYDSGASWHSGSSHANHTSNICSVCVIVHHIWRICFCCNCFKLEFRPLTSLTNFVITFWTQCNLQWKTKS